MSQKLQKISSMEKSILTQCVEKLNNSLPSSIKMGAVSQQKSIPGIVHYDKNSPQSSQSQQQVNPIQENNNTSGQKEPQVKTDYPYTKKQIFQMFKQKHIPGQKTYELLQAKEILKQHLLDMSEYGYDFKIKKWHFKESRNGQVFWKQMRRKVYVRYQCMNCKQAGKRKKWTSILGLAQVKFMVTDLVKFIQKFPKFRSSKQSPEKQALKMKYKNIVQWELEFYRQKCKICRRWGRVRIYQKQLEALCKSFCWIISQILAGVKREKKYNDDRHKNRDVHKHEQELCEACEKGKCFNIPKDVKGKSSI